MKKLGWLAPAVVFLLAAVLWLCLWPREEQPPQPEQSAPQQPAQQTETEQITEHRMEAYLVPVPFSVVYCDDPTLPEGQQEVLFEGVPGQKELRAEAVYVNGSLESLGLVESVQVTEPTCQVVAVGTGEQIGQERRFPLTGDGVLVTASGEYFYYTHHDTYNATAYTSWLDGTTGTTATGTQARVGAIAVDPRVIPYGTRMYIVSVDGQVVYGVATAEDCGGAIKGKIVDLFFDTYEECVAFGRRDVTIYFLV